MDDWDLAKVFNSLMFHFQNELQPWIYGVLLLPWFHQIFCFRKLIIEKKVYSQFGLGQWSLQIHTFTPAEEPNNN